jgi:hypothetical protein
VVSTYDRQRDGAKFRCNNGLLFSWQVAMQSYNRRAEAAEYRLDLEGEGKRRRRTGLAVLCPAVLLSALAVQLTFKATGLLSKGNKKLLEASLLKQNTKEK